MRKILLRSLTVGALALLIGASIGEGYAEARAGGGRSMGSRGSRSYSRPATPYSQPAPSAQPAPQRPAYTPPPYQQPQPARGGFLRSMAGGIVGGMLGGMLFRGLGFGGGWGGGMGGSGIGLFEIILLAGIGYLIYRFVKARRQETPVYREEPLRFESYDQPTLHQQQAPPQLAASGGEELERGISHIRQMDASFDEARFKDQVMDNFFRIQGAWMHRDLTPVASLLTPEMRRIMQDDVDRLLREKRINRLENIAVRSVEVTEAWQEQGWDFITALIYANLLDYTTDEAGTVVGGSNTDPVKFEEYWTFARPVGSSTWQLTAIDQK